MTTRRIHHAAHTGVGTGWDLEEFDVLASETTWTPWNGAARPVGIHADAEYHSGSTDKAGAQHWIFFRRLPFGPGQCERCTLRLR